MIKKRKKKEKKKEDCKINILEIIKTIITSMT